MPKRLLIAEDDDDIRFLLSGLLSSVAGPAEVVAVSDAPLAVERVASGASYDCVILDVCMPGDYDGLEGARRIRALRPTLPIAFLTGAPERLVVSVLDDLRRTGPCHVWTKPHALSDLPRLITTLLEAPPPAPSLKPYHDESAESAESESPQAERIVISKKADKARRAGRRLAPEDARALADWIKLEWSPRFFNERRIQRAQGVAGYESEEDMRCV